MYYAQIDPQDTASLIDPDQANPGGGWDIIRPLLEEQGYLFIELDKPELTGTHYDRSAEKFYTPEQETQKNEDEKFNLMMLEAIADSYEQGMKQEEQNLAILDGIASLYEAQLGAEGVTK